MESLKSVLYSSANKPIGSILGLLGGAYVASKYISKNPFAIGGVAIIGMVIGGTLEHAITVKKVK